MKEFDVAVVGAGLAGLYAARVLGEMGWRVALIDRKRDIGSSVHTTGIFVRKTFEDFRFPSSCLGPALREVRLFSPHGRMLELASPQDEFRVGDMPRLYRSLLNEACDAGVTWFPATKFLSLESADDQNRLFIENGEGKQVLNCRFVIGADGAKSRVAQALGLHRNKRFLVGAEAIYSVGANEPNKPGLYCYLDPKLAPGYLAWVTLDGCDKHVGVAGLDGQFSPRRALTAFTSKVADRFGLAESDVLERRGGLIQVGGIGNEIGCSRGLLIGDATGAVSPLTGGGLDPCLRLTKFACKLINAHLANPETGFLAAYNGRRFRSRFAKRLFLRRMMNHMTNPLLCETAFILLSFQPFKALANQIFFRRGSFPDPEPIPIRSLET